MRRVRGAWRRAMPARIGATVVAGLLLVGAPAAGAKSVTDPDIGWPTALRKELRLPKLSPRECTKTDRKQQDRRLSRIDRRDPDLSVRLRGILRYGGADVWGMTWSTACDGGRQQVGVASGASAGATRRAVRRVRARLKEQRLTDDVRLVAVRSTYKQLAVQVDAVNATVEVSPGIRADRNAVAIDVGNRTPPAELEALKAFEASSPTNVVLDIEPPADPNAPIPTYEVPFAIDRASVDRDGRELAVTIDDPDCFADVTNDSQARFAGVRIRRGAHAWVLTARLRVNPDWRGAATCEGNVDPRTTVTTTVTLPAPLGRRGVVDGAEGPGGFRMVKVEPVGAGAIRSLVPRYAYADDTCEVAAVRRAFRGRPKSDWCFF